MAACDHEVHKGGDRVLLTELVETRSEALSHQVAFGAAIVVGGILMHYLVARGLAAWETNPEPSKAW